MLFPLAGVASEGTAAVPSTLWDLKVNALDGKPFDFKTLEGKVVLVVNTASQCGYTPQYEGLEKLQQSKAGQGLVVVGFPSNDFGGQEPGTSEEIRQFCTTRFKVTFPMMSKVKTKGADKSQAYAFLSAKHGEPDWNFNKYLVGRDGTVKKLFSSKVEPLGDVLTKAIDAELAKPAKADPTSKGKKS